MKYNGEKSIAQIYAERAAHRAAYQREYRKRNRERLNVYTKQYLETKRWLDGSMPYCKFGKDCISCPAIDCRVG